MEFVNLILQPIVESLTVHVKKHIDFMTSCKKYVRDMGNNMRELKATRVNVEKQMEDNKRNRIEIPAQVPGWLEEVVKVDAEVNRISNSNVGGCFSFKTRHGVGKKAFELIQVIKRLTEEHSRIVWTHQQIPLGEVDSMTSEPPVSEYHNDFGSREETFMKALKALEPDHQSHMMALCGMGGVGKTTMMEKLKTVLTEKRMFSLIVKVVIGEKPNLFDIQRAVADYLTIDLKEKDISARAEKLRAWFKSYSTEEGKKKILVILDDIWQLVDFKDIGLSPLPDQGVDFKVLLTSRKRDVCTRMGVKANSIFDVNVLENAEAQRFFWKFIKDSDEAEADLDPDLRNVGDDIVKRCQGLPIAIKTIAITLRGKSKSIWEDTLTKLQHHDINEIVNEVFELSYKNLEDEETKSVFLLCGLYPEDFDIPTEELVRYGWGLKLFKKVYTVRQARNRLNACIEQLVNANLLIESNHAGSIKMHDLTRAFVLIMYSKSEHASIVNFGNMSEWPANDTPDSCKRISLAFNGMKEFPTSFEYPNLSFLKLTHGDKSLRFPKNFYGLMEKLQVIVYEDMQYPLLPGSFEYSSNLRTLCLHECSLMFDCRSIGSLLNLEVLSFAHCRMRKLPFTIGNLKKLKLLDMTGCVNLHIDDGVLKELVNLEELYMRVAGRKVISFTDGNFNELADRSRNLFAIEIELFGNNTHPKRMSFNKLDRFKISIGRFLEEKDEKTKSFENTLMLVSNKGELLESRINVLFEKTVVLHLEVDDMNDLEDFKVKPLHSIEYSSFYKLRVLNISKCPQLRYLFTRHVAATLLKLEHLEVLSCNIMKTLIHDEDSGSEPIKFPSLKFLALGGLPKLVGLCETGSVIELPQLMELRVDGPSDITTIFPDNILGSSSISSYTSTMQPFLNEEVPFRKSVHSNEYSTCYTLRLKVLKISEGGHLRYLFTHRVATTLSRLEHLTVRSCDIMQTLIHDEHNGSETIRFPSLKFLKLDRLPKLAGLCNSVNIIELPQLMEVELDGLPNFTCIFPDENLASTSMSSDTFTAQPFFYKEVAIPKLETLQISRMNKLTNIWSIEVTCSNNVSFPMLKKIAIVECDRLVNVWSLNNVDSSNDCIIHGFEAVESIEISECANFENLFTPITANFNLEALQEIDISPVQQNNAITRDIVFSTHLIHTFHQLRTLTLKHDRESQVVFDIQSATSTGELMSTSQYNHQHQLLPSLENLYLSDMDNMSHVWKCNWNQFFILHPPKSLCHNLTNISLSDCRSIKYLFSPLMFKFLSNLKYVHIEYCEVMEEIVSNRDDKDEQMTFFPSIILDTLHIDSLKSLQHIGGNGDRCSSIYHELQPGGEEAVALRWSLCQYSRVIEIEDCSALSSAIPSYALAHMQHLQELEICIRLLPDLRNLRILFISSCHLLRDVFPFSTLQSLTKLQHLEIRSCPGIRVIVKEKEEEDGNHTTSSSSSSSDHHQVPVVFASLKFVKLSNLRNLEGFFLGTNNFRWPVLDSVEIKECPKMRMFTKGDSETPMLKYVVSDMGEHSVECGKINNLFHHPPPPTTTAAFLQQQQEEVEQKVPYDPSLDGSTTSLPPISPRTRMPWFYNHLITVHVRDRWVGNPRFIIRHNELQHLQKIENINISWCSAVKGIFETFEMSSGLNQQTHSVLEFIATPRATYKRVPKNGNEDDEEEDEQNNDRKEDEDDDGRRLNGDHKKDEREHDDDRRENEVEFPCLRTLTLRNLRSLKGFCLGMETIHWPSLDTLQIKSCPKITTFTIGQSTTPKLRLIDTSFGLCDATEGVNSFIRTKIEEGYEFE
uniref:uncharacterized protein LOC122590817 n=1 Tax=Erigeron canadensis TaxID=72917 RepID=UPI001CB91DEB|nr:uncharacterized protein LOC122590817 [Erigeron canadensis]